MKKLFIQTYGCQMNLADSEEMAAHLLLRGYALTDNLDEADLALVNTCTVRDHAEHRALSFLGRLRQWKREKEGRRIIFAGCAAQRLGEKLKKNLSVPGPGVRRARNRSFRLFAGQQRPVRRGPRRRSTAPRNNRLCNHYARL